MKNEFFINYKLGFVNKKNLSQVLINKTIKVVLLTSCSEALRAFDFPSEQSNKISCYIY